MSSNARKNQVQTMGGSIRRWFEPAVGIGAGLVALWLGPVAVAAFLAVCLGLAVAGWKVRRRRPPQRG